MIEIPAGPATATRRARLRDPRAIRRRAVAMLRLRLGGYRMGEIAERHHLTDRHVRRELTRLGDDDRTAIERAWRRDLLGPGGWKLIR